MVNIARNKALLIGINYTGTSSALQGCINDVNNVRRYLGEHFATVNEVQLTNARDRGADESGDDKDDYLVFQFKDGNVQDATVVHGSKWQQDESDFLERTARAGDDTLTVLILTDSQRGRHSPTRANILAAMDWLVRDARPGDRRFIHYSGHGTQVRDTNGDELSGQDQALCPLDYKTAGLLIDDDIRRHLIDPLPQGCQLRGIFDCCHSQSLADLRYNFRDVADIQNLHAAVIENPHEPESAADVAIFSGCLDSQTSADAYWKGGWAGALTAAFMEIMRDPAQRDHSYRALFHRLTEVLREKRYTQKPQLSSGRPLDLMDTFDLF